MNPHLQPLIDHLKQLPALPPFDQLKGLLADLVTDDRTRKLLLLAAEKQVLQAVLNRKEAPDAVFQQQKINYLMEEHFLQKEVAEECLALSDGLWRGLFGASLLTESNIKVW